MRLIENSNDNHSHLDLQDFFYFFNCYLLLRNKVLGQIERFAHS